MADALVRIGADLSELNRALKSIPNQTSDAAQKALIALERQVKNTSKLVSRTLKSQQKAAEAADAASREGAKALYELSGGSGDVLEKVAKLGASLTNPFIAAGAAIAATTLGVAALGGAIVGSVVAAADFGEELKKFKNIDSLQVVDLQGLREIQEAASAVKSLGVVAKGAVVALASELAPAVKAASTLMLTLGLAALDTFNTFLDGGDAIRSLSTWLVEGLAKAALRPVDAIVELMRTIGRLADLAGQDELAGQIHKLVKGYDLFIDTVVGGGVDAAFYGLSVASAGLTNRFSDNHDQALRLINSMQDLEYGAKGAKTQVDQLGDSLRAQQEASKAQVEGYFSALDALEKMEAASRSSSQSAEQRALAERAAALDAADRAYLEAAALAETITAKETLEAQYRATREALEAEHEEKISAIRQDSADAALKAAQDYQARLAAAEEKALAGAAARTQAHWDLALSIVDSARSVADSIGAVLEIAIEQISSVYDRYDARAERSAERITALQEKLASGRGRLSDAEVASIEAEIAAAEQKRSAEREAAKEARKMGMRAFKAGKALSIASIVGSTGAAVAAALAPPPIGAGPLLGIPLAVATGAAGAAQIATVAATQPPAFDIGGLIGSKTPDQVIIRALPGERVQSRAEVAREKTGAREPIVVVQQHRARVLEVALQDNLTLPGSTLNSMKMAGRRLGHRSR